MQRPLRQQLCRQSRSVLENGKVLDTCFQDSELSGMIAGEKVFGTRRQAPRNGSNVIIFSSRQTYSTVCFSPMVIQPLFKPPSVSQ